MTKLGNHRKRRPGIAMLALAALWTANAWADGCAVENVAVYQIGQTAYIDVSNDVPVGNVVRTGRATGEGKVLLRCRAGVAQFNGATKGETSGDLVLLTVNGQPSGFGVRVTMQEEHSGPMLTFPHRYDRTFMEGETLTSDSDYVAYDIVRVPGKVVFGPIDRGRVALQTVSKPNGENVLFRSMEIFELVLRRPTCTITDATLKQEVKLGDFNPSNFATPDRATPWVPFSFEVLECKEPLGMIAQFTFGTPSDADADLPSVFSMKDSGSKNVGIEIADKHEKTIRPGELFETNALASGEFFQFNARLRETRPSVIGGGAFLRPVTVQIDFY